MSLHVNAPAATSTTIESCHCPTCGRERPMLVSTYQWYAPHSTCLGCGDQWNGSEMQERPFARGWRNRSIEDAKRRARWLGLEVPS